MQFLGLGLGEIILIVGVLLLLFGAAKLPELGKSIGLFGKEVKKGFSDDSKEDKAKDK
jgi:sec-independent protein translocase protein TatA